jgi:hypothetical protein
MTNFLWARRQCDWSQTSSEPAKTETQISEHESDASALLTRIGLIEENQELKAKLKYALDNWIGTRYDQKQINH